MLALLNIALQILIADYLNNMNMKPKRKKKTGNTKEKRLLKKKKEVIQEENSEAELSRSGGG